MTDEITATKAELVNELVTLTKMNRDLIDKIVVMQVKIDDLTVKATSRATLYSHQHGRLLEVRKHLRTVKKELKMIHKSGITEDGINFLRSLEDD